MPTQSLKRPSGMLAAPTAAGPAQAWKRTGYGTWQRGNEVQKGVRGNPNGPSAAGPGPSGVQSPAPKTGGFANYQTLQRPQMYQQMQAQQQRQPMGDIQSFNANPGANGQQMGQAFGQQMQRQPYQFNNVDPGRIAGAMQQMSGQMPSQGWASQYPVMKKY